MDTLPLSFETLARGALECRFDLCQFEFAVQPWRLSRSAIKRWRVPIALAGATLIVAVAGANLQWLMLARQRDLLAAQQIEVLMSAFPNTTAVLDPPRQMTRQLDALRLKAGALSPHDFLTLVAGLAASLGPIPETAIVKLDYQDRMLAVSFNPEAKIDSAFAQRLISNGLDGRLSSGKWIIRSRR